MINCKVNLHCLFMQCDKITVLASNSSNMLQALLKLSESYRVHADLFTLK